MLQAPIELVFGSTWANTCQLGSATHCTIPHLLGFCKLLQWQQLPDGSYSRSTLFWGSGALADLLLWVLLRLQHRLFASHIYSKVSGLIRPTCVSPPDWLVGFMKQMSLFIDTCQLLHHHCNRDLYVIGHMWLCFVVTVLLVLVHTEESFMPCA